MALEMMRLQGQAFFGNHSEIRRKDLGVIGGWYSPKRGVALDDLG